jgi:hypothetical protein
MTSANYILAGTDNGNDPDQMKGLYNTGAWSWLAFSYNGGGLNGGQAAASFYTGNNFIIAAGTGVPADGNIVFYSGGGAGDYEESRVKGADLAALGNAGASWINLSGTASEEYIATIGNGTGVPPPADDFWPGYISDFRIYSGALTTGQMYSIFTGNGAI